MTEEQTLPLTFTETSASMLQSKFLNISFMEVGYDLTANTNRLKGSKLKMFSLLTPFICDNQKFNVHKLQK